MKIFIIRKSISNAKDPIVRHEFETHAETVGEFIREMVEHNYNIRPVKDTLDECVKTALYDFADGCIYIVNHTRHFNYDSLDETLDLHEGDEIMLVKLKYVRGIIW